MKALSPVHHVHRIPAWTSLLFGIAGVTGNALTGSQSRFTWAVSGGFLLVGLMGACLKRSWAANLCLMASSAAVAIYVTEATVELVSVRAQERERELKIRYAESRGGAYDLRTQGEYLVDVRSNGRNIYPAFPRGLLLQSNGEATKEVLIGRNGKPLVPMGSISLVETVRGNETGDFLVYSSDELGFHNPQGIWNISQLQIAAVGDSFVQGESVPSDSNMIAAIRRRVPRTVNLGHGGNGPLSQLATVLEYLPRRKPAIVLWFFCEENDIPEDLEREKRSPVMMGYLETPPRLQGLEKRQDEIDQTLRDFFEGQFPSVVPIGTQRSRVPEWLALDKLAYLIYGLRHPPNHDFELFERVLNSAKQAVASWNGTLVFVYLPSQVSTTSEPLRPFRGARSQQIREEVLRITSALGIGVLDLDQKFREDASKTQDYFYPYPAHLTAAGYQRAGNLIVDELSKLGLVTERQRSSAVLRMH